MTYYDPRTFRLDGCYGYADIYGYGPGYGSAHEGFRPNYIPPPAVNREPICASGCPATPCGTTINASAGCNGSYGNPIPPPSSPCIPPGFTGYQPVMGRPYIYNTPNGTFYGTYYPYGPWTNIPSAPLVLPVGLPPAQPPCVMP